jgi:hypothetical protein
VVNVREVVEDAPKLSVVGLGWTARFLILLMPVVVNRGRRGSVL